MNEEMRIWPVHLVNKCHPNEAIRNNNNVFVAKTTEQEAGRGIVIQLKMRILLNNLFFCCFNTWSQSIHLQDRDILSAVTSKHKSTVHTMRQRLQKLCIARWYEVHNRAQSSRYFHFLWFSWALCCVYVCASLQNMYNRYILFVCVFVGICRYNGFH